MHPDLLRAFAAEVEQVYQTLPEPVIDPSEVYFVVRKAVEHPEWRIKDYLDAFEKQRSRKIALSVKTLMEREGLWLGREREVLRDAFLHVTDPILTLFTLTSQPVTADLYARVREFIREQPNSLMLSLLIVGETAFQLRKHSDSEHVSLGKQIHQLLTQRASREAPHRLLMHLFDIAAQHHQFEQRNVLDTLRDLNDKAAELAEPAQYGEGQEESTAEDALTIMAQENADLRSSLRGMQHELTRLETHIQQDRARAQDEAIFAFLSQMNHVSHGYLLDRLVQNAVDVEERMNQGWQPALDVEGPVYLVTALRDFFTQAGVTPLRAIGERATVTLHDLRHIQYIGSEFQDDSDEKQVEFRTSGWGYQGRVLSRPEAVEVAS